MAAAVVVATAAGGTVSGARGEAAAAFASPAVRIGGSGGEGNGELGTRHAAVGAGERAVSGRVLFASAWQLGQPTLSYM